MTSLIKEQSVKSDTRGKSRGGDMGSLSLQTLLICRVRQVIPVLFDSVAPNVSGIRKKVPSRSVEPNKNVSYLITLVRNSQLVRF